MRIPPAVAALGDAAGIWTRRQALSAGLTAGQVDARLRSGTWQTLHRGIYCDGGTTPHPAQRAGAACLAAGAGSVATGRTAARVHGLPLVDDDDPATGSCQHGLDDVATKSGVHRARRLGTGSPDVPATLALSQEVFEPEDVVLVSGVRVTTPARTLFHLAREQTFGAAVAAADHALRSESVTKEELSTLAARLGGRRGIVAFRRVVDFADARAETAFESVTRVVVTAPDLPAWTPQLKVRLGDRVVARVDLGNDALRLAVESDGGAHHSGTAVARDRTRDALIGAGGWYAVHVTWYDARVRPDSVRARVRAVALERSRAAA